MKFHLQHILIVDAQRQKYDDGSAEKEDQVPRHNLGHVRPEHVQILTSRFVGQVQPIFQLMLQFVKVPVSIFSSNFDLSNKNTDFFQVCTEKSISQKSTSAGHPTCPALVSQVRRRRRASRKFARRKWRATGSNWARPTTGRYVRFFWLNKHENHTYLSVNNVIPIKFPIHKPRNCDLTKVMLHSKNLVNYNI